jgi:hypothetical protein
MRSWSPPDVVVDDVVIGRIVVVDVVDAGNNVVVVDTVPQSPQNSSSPRQSVMMFPSQSIT